MSKIPRRVRRSIDWISSNLSSFSPWRGQDVSTLGVKSFAELAFLALQMDSWIRDARPIAEAVGRESLAACCSEWFEHIIEHIESRVYAETCRKHAGQAWPWLFPYLCLRSVGYRNRQYEAIVKLFGERGYVLAPERVPYRVMEVEYLLHRAGLRHHKADWRAMILRGSLLRWADPIYVSDDAVYALTHTVMYASDLGSKPMPLIPVEHRLVVDQIKCFIVHYTREKFWDLLGELLVAAHNLGMGDDSLVAMSSKEFIEAWRSNGTVAAFGDGRMPAGREQQRPGEAFWDGSEWENCYHTTLVWLMFAAVCFRPDALARMPSR